MVIFSDLINVKAILQTRMTLLQNGSSVESHREVQVYQQNYQENFDNAGIQVINLLYISSILKNQYFKFKRSIGTVFALKKCVKDDLSVRYWNQRSKNLQLSDLNKDLARTVRMS